MALYEMDNSNVPYKKFGIVGKIVDEFHMFITMCCIFMVACVYSLVFF